MEAQVYQRMAELDASHWWFVARRQILDSIIRRIVRPPRGAQILEIGCGTGHNLEMLSQFGRVSATELDTEARALATKRLGRAVQAAALPDLSAYSESAFDLIALLDVLEHVADDRSALDAIWTRLKPGGKLILTVPANPWMWSAHDTAHHHHRRYRRAQLGRLATDCDYQIELLGPFNTILFPLIAAARVASKVMGRDGADDSMPPTALNKLLRSLFAVEAGLIGRVPMLFGVSLVAVLRRPDSV
jgi:SAM-dependent methyltransferase